MKALTIYGKGDLRVADVPPEPLGPSQVRLRMRCGGICGTDLHYLHHGGIGTIRVREPVVLGHEAAGEVVEVGLGVTKFVPGDLVAVSPSRPCGQCDYCLEGLPNHCTHMAFFGSAISIPHVDGAFREELVVDVAQCVRAEGLEPSLAAMAEPLAVCLHAAHQAGDLVGKRVLITGSGPIGVLMTLVARRAGAAEITVTDMLDAPLDFARQAGADRVFNTAVDPEALSADQVGKGRIDVQFECSGAEAALAAGIHALRPRGVAVLLAAGSDMQVPMQPAMVKELTLRGAFRFHPEFAVAVDLMQKRLIDVRPLITHTFPFTAHEEAFAVAADKSRSMKVQLEFS